jgi:glycosyltransferase involved in cell wall biosynthesis
MRSFPAVGGTETVAQRVSIELASEVHVSVLSSNLLDLKGKRFDDKRLRFLNGVSVHKFPAYNVRLKGLFLYPFVYPEMRGHLRKQQAKRLIIHTHSFPSFHSYVALELLVRRGVPVIVTPHYDVDSLAKNPIHLTHMKLLGRLISRRKLKLVAITERERSFYVHRLHYASKSIVVIPNGVDLNELTVNNDQVEQTRTIFPADRLIILYVGRVAKIKGIGLLLQAASNLNVSYHLIIAGPDGGYLNDAIQLARKLNMRDRVTFTGELHRTALTALYRICDIFVLPSYGGEAFGITLAEAMACGKPVIASKTGGIPELVHNGEEGYLVQAGNPAQLRDRLQTLAWSNGLRTEMGRKGRKRIDARYTWEKIGGQYLRLVNDMEQT